MEVLFLVGLLGLIPAIIAQKKGRDFIGWWLYGTLFFIIALPHALLAGENTKAIEKRAIDDGGVRKCPACAELVKAEAKVCRFCQRDLPDLAPPAPTAGLRQQADLMAMEQYNISFDGTSYYYRGKPYSTLERAVTMAADVPVTMCRER